jgi:SNF2 family DNA or RNA helicase
VDKFDFFFQKLAVMLQPHQQRVVDKMDDEDAMLIYHTPGSGKTLTALAVAEAEKMPLTVTGPASLRNNFAKEKAKHKIKAYVDTFTYNKPSASTKGVLAFDEAHKMGRIGTKRSQYPDYIKGKKTMFLTGTPIRNRPDELVPIMRGLGIKMNKGADQFNDEYIAKIKTNPGFFARVFKGAEPEIEYRARNLDKLKKLLKNKVDYYEPLQEEFPTTNESTIRVEMSKKQEAAYDMALKQDPGLKYKVQHGIAPSKAESKRMNAFMIATRQIGNSPKEYNTSSTADDEPKINRAALEIEKRFKADKNYRGVTYSSYIKHGLDPLENRLKAKNIPYARYTGKMSQTDRDAAIKSYNSGKIKHLLISGAGGEGLDLKGTKLLQTLEPHWNDPVMQQIKARAVRFRSHAALPENERNVEIQNYVAMPRKHGIIFKTRAKGADEYLQMMADKKKKLNDEFLNALKEVGSK